MSAFGETPQNEIYEEIKRQQEESGLTNLQTIQMIAEIISYIAEFDD